MTKRKADSAIEAKVTASGASVRVSADALTTIGQAANWLFPKQSAKAKITSALASRVAERIQVGSALDADDKYFVARLFDRQARALENAERTAEVVRRVLPESKERMEALPPIADAGEQSSVLVSRAESIASEILPEDIRELFISCCRR